MPRRPGRATISLSVEVLNTPAVERPPREKGRSNETDDHRIRHSRRRDAGTRAGRIEDRRGGCERGGWAPPLFDDEAASYLHGVYQRADVFLFGRWTCEIFAGYWGAFDDPGDPIRHALNARPKYLASTTLTDAQWADTTVLSGTSRSPSAS
jgi:hypothetical protein